MSTRTEVVFGNACTESRVATRWLVQHFTLVPGAQRYNFRRRPEIDSGRRFTCSHGSYSVANALRHLATVHRGIESLLTHNLHTEAVECADAWRSVEEAAEFILERYAVRDFRDHLSFRPLDSHHTVARPIDQLASLAEFPLISILAARHGDALSRNLISEAREERFRRQR